MNTLSNANSCLGGAFLVPDILCGVRYNIKDKLEFVPIGQKAIIDLCKVVLTFEFVDEIAKYDHSDESYRAVLSCAVYYAVQGDSNIKSVSEIQKCDHSNDSN